MFLSILEFHSFSTSLVDHLTQSMTKLSHIDHGSVSNNATEVGT